MADVIGKNEELLTEKYFYPLKGDDVPERKHPTFHQEELIGRTADGRIRTVRVDNQGRLVLSPGSVPSTDPMLTSKLDEIVGILNSLVEVMGNIH